MDQVEDLARRVFEIAEAVRSGEVDALDFHLLESYRELRETDAEIHSKLSIDEMLNEVLGAKVTRVQELAKILAAPELYVEKLKALTPREITKLACYSHPITIGRLEMNALTRSLDRVMHLLDAMSKEVAEERPPKMSGIPEGFTFETEDAVFLEDLERFASTIKTGKRLPLASLIASDDFEEFLLRFLYVVVLISKGVLVYYRESREILKKNSRRPPAAQ